MKPKSILRTFIGIAGSSLLAITHASAVDYYYDTDGDGTTDVGSVNSVATGTDPISVTATVSSGEAVDGKLFGRLTATE